jgi:hypothetical protein
MRSFIVPGGLGAFAVCCAACAVQVEEPVEMRAAVGRNEGARVEREERYVTLTRDWRECAPPACGGYFTREVNTDAAPEYVSKIVFASRSLGAEVVESLHSAAVSELVLLGHIGPADLAFGARAFVVREAFRGLPGRAPQPGDRFYGVRKPLPAVDCFIAPCARHVAEELNVAAHEEVDRVALEEAALPFVDKAWLQEEIRRDSALIAGRVTAATPGIERLLVASQVFVRLPERRGLCVARRRPSCGEWVATFRRTADRCLVFDRCVEPAVCQEAVVACAEGYTQEAWPAAPAGCSAFACDPAFVAR